MGHCILHCHRRLSIRVVLDLDFERSAVLGTVRDLSLEKEFRSNLENLETGEWDWDLCRLTQEVAAETEEPRPGPALITEVCSDRVTWPVK